MHLQGQIDQLVERVSNLRAQDDERRDDKIETEMHALTKMPCSRPTHGDAGPTNRRIFTVLIMPCRFDPYRTRRQRLSTIARVVKADVTLFCNGLHERHDLRQMRAIDFGWMFDAPGCVRC